MLFVPRDEIKSVDSLLNRPKSRGKTLTLFLLVSHFFHFFFCSELITIFFFGRIIIKKCPEIKVRRLLNLTVSDASVADKVVSDRPLFMEILTRIEVMQPARHVCKTGCVLS